MSSIPKSQANPQDLANVQEVKFQNEVGIAQAKILLIGRMQITSDPGESVKISSDVGVLDGELYRIRAEYHAFMAEQSTLQMPTPNEVQQAKDATRKLAGLVATSSTVTDILKFTIEVLATWNGGKKQ